MNKHTIQFAESSNGDSCPNCDKQEIVKIFGMKWGSTKKLFDTLSEKEKHDLSYSIIISCSFCGYSYHLK